MSYIAHMCEQWPSMHNVLAREELENIFLLDQNNPLWKCALSIKMMPSHHPLLKCAYWIASRCNFCTFYSQVHPLHNHQKSETYSQLIISLLAPSGKKYYCVQIFLKVWASQNYDYINYNLPQRKVQCDVWQGQGTSLQQNIKEN